MPRMTRSGVVGDGGKDEDKRTPGNPGFFAYLCSSHAVQVGSAGSRGSIMG